MAATEERTYTVPELREHWQEDGELAEVGQSLIERWPRRFGHIGAEEVWWGWRKNGGREGRKDRLCGIIIPTAASPLMHFARRGILVYLSADHVKQRNLNTAQIEALVFHAMMMIGKNAKGLPIKRAPDFSGFQAELQQYGYWSEDLEKIANVQLGLGLIDEDPEAEGGAQQPEGAQTNGRTNGRGKSKPPEEGDV